MLAPGNVGDANISVVKIRAAASCTARGRGGGSENYNIFVFYFIPKMPKANMSVLPKR
jgi:hypothetical protein